MKDSDMVKFLESLPDQSAILDSANLLIIPKSGTAGVVVSQSYLYESLCYIKDLKWLNKSADCAPHHLRLSKIPAHCFRFKDNEIESIIAKQAV